MDTLEKELSDLKSFIADIKADRAAQKDKEKREAWTKYTSMSIVIIAVLAAVATQWSGKYGSRTLVELNKSTFNQALASDKWSYYQANSIKQNLYETVHDLVPKDAAANAADAAKREEIFTAKVNKYTTTKDQTFKEAKELEAKRDEAQAAATESSKRGSAMGSAVAIFQISIALGSICLVTKRKSLWYLSLLLAVIATVKMVMVLKS
jgi:hypothetical protein